MRLPSHRQCLRAGADGVVEGALREARSWESSTSGWTNRAQCDRVPRGSRRLISQSSFAGEAPVSVASDGRRSCMRSLERSLLAYDRVHVCVHCQLQSHSLVPPKTYPGQLNCSTLHASASQEPFYGILLVAARGRRSFSSTSFSNAVAEGHSHSALQGNLSSHVLAECSLKVS